MRRFAAIAVLAIAATFLGSILILDRLDGGGADPTPPTASEVRPDRAPAPVPDPAEPALPRVPPQEIARQLAAPPTDPTPAPPPPAPLPPSGAPPAPVYVRQQLGALEARVVSRCGSMTLRLGDQLRKEGRDPGDHAVLLLDVEPLEGEVKIWGVSIQSPGMTRPALVACAQHTLRGHQFEVSALRPGERYKVQLVVGVRE